MVGIISPGSSPPLDTARFFIVSAPTGSLVNISRNVFARIWRTSCDFPVDGLCRNIGGSSPLAPVWAGIFFLCDKKRVIHLLLVLATSDKLCKQFGPRLGPTTQTVYSVRPPLGRVGRHIYFNHFFWKKI